MYFANNILIVMEVWNNFHSFEMLHSSMWNCLNWFFMCSRLCTTKSKCYRAFYLLSL